MTTRAHSRAHLRIENSDLVGRNATVTLNGEDISHQVQRIEVLWAWNEVNRAIVTLLVDELVVDGETLLYRADQWEEDPAAARRCEAGYLLYRLATCLRHSDPRYVGSELERDVREFVGEPLDAASEEAGS